MQSETRSWLATHEMLFASQDKSAKPCTHTLLDGGVVVLSSADDYTQMYRCLARDIITIKGQIAICENFPRITGEWKRPEIPPPHLISRSSRFMYIGRDEKHNPIPHYVVHEPRFKTDISLNPPTMRVWATCCYAVDADYGEYDPAVGWNLVDIIEDVRVMQAAMLETNLRDGEPDDPRVARCFICIADADNKLGLHLYFPYSRYFPEQCMHLATIMSSRLQERRPQRGAKSWSDIIDVGIYNASLRLPMVQKAKRCTGCENKFKRRKQCQHCYQRGFVYADRRYWPILQLDEHGRWLQTESRWLDSMNDFVKGRTGWSEEFRRAHLPDERKIECAPLPALPPKILEMQSRRPVMTLEKCTDMILCFLTLCSLRLKGDDGSVTWFQPHHLLPRPLYPKSWIHFFGSVIAAAKPPQNPTLVVRVNKAVSAISSSASSSNLPAAARMHGVCTPNSNSAAADDPDVNAILQRLTVLKLNVTPWSNPGGTANTPAHVVNKDRDRHQLEADAAAAIIGGRPASKYQHLIINPREDSSFVKQFATGVFGEFKECETIANDRQGRCKRLEAYLRSFTCAEYRELQVLKIHHSLKYGNSLVQVGGPGRHFCMIAGRNHRRCVVFFQVFRRSQLLHQFCFHPNCKGRHYNWGTITQYDLQLLFAPKEMLPVCGDKTDPEVRAAAEELLETSKALTSKCVKSRRAKKTTGVATAPSPSPNPSPNQQQPFLRAPPPAQVITTPNGVAALKFNTSLDEKDPLPTLMSPHRNAEVAAVHAPGVAVDHESIPPESPCILSDLESDSELPKTPVPRKRKQPQKARAPCFSFQQILVGADDAPPSEKSK
jgi:hypothetical protein